MATPSMVRSSRCRVLPYAPGSAIPFGGPQNVSEFDQSVSWIHGRHSLKFGGDTFTSGITGYSERIRKEFSI